MMGFRGQNVPILYNSDRASIFGTQQWVAKGTTQRIGATIFASLFFFASIALFFSSAVARVEIARDTGGVLGQVFGIAFALLAFLIGCAALYVAFRVTRGVIRSFRK